MQNSPQEQTPDDANIAAFGRAIDALRAEVEAQIGEADRHHLARIRRLSRRLELTGRGLLQLCFEPVGFTAGVAALSVHKCLELMELGHMALHGAYEQVTSEPAMQAASYVWRAPIDEASWHRGHNIRHHQFTNIAGRDPDIDFGKLRLSPRVAYQRWHRLQPISNLITWLGFSTAINMHVTGMLEQKGTPTRPAVRRGSTAEARTPKQVFMSKARRYYTRELVVFPALAGPFFWKVALGNALSEVARDLVAGSIIYCGHVGAADYPEGTKSGSRARWYAMQVESASNVDMSRPFSILVGALDRQIEHHLFPRLPPNRLREIAPRVQALCAQHGVTYRSAGFRASLRGALKSLYRMSRPVPVADDPAGSTNADGAHAARPAPAAPPAAVYATT